MRIIRIKAESSVDKKLGTCIDLGIKIRRIKRTEDMRVWRRIKAERSVDKKLRTCIDLGIKIWMIKRTAGMIV
jgi:hypothetical protein